MKTKKGVKCLSRGELTKKICQKANLPRGKKTNEYFTKDQLVYLLIMLERTDSI
jgi:hypothetical protein